MLKQYLKTPPRKNYNFEAEFGFLLKTLKNNHYSAKDWWKNIKSSFKENLRTVSKNSTTQENMIISRVKEDCKTYTKKKNSNQKLD